MGGGGGSASNAWDISAATYLQTYNFSDGNNRGGLAIAHSGTRLYAVDSNRNMTESINLRFR